jgi:hypothetical protein
MSGKPGKETCGRVVCTVSDGRGLWDQREERRYTSIKKGRCEDERRKKKNDGIPYTVTIFV